MAKDHTEHGDATIARAGQILLTEVGSGLHGIAIPGTDDHDEMGVFIEPAGCVIGLAKPMDTYTYRTQPEGRRSRPGDTDRVLYALRKYLRLATDGNPTVLAMLFAPEQSVYATTELGEELRALAPSFLSLKVVDRSAHYLDSQVEKLLGRGHRGSMPKRPELVEKYGYDTKFASHALRLGYQGLEIAEHGHLTLPMPEPEREAVLKVKSGGMPDLDAVLWHIRDLRDRMMQVVETGRTPLPPAPDWDRLSAWSVSAHQRHWQATEEASDVD